MQKVESSSLDTLEAQVGGTPLLRRVAMPLDLEAPSAIYCFKRELAAATSWFQRRAGRKVERVVAMDGVFAKWRRLPRAEPSLQRVVFGEQLRSKANRLAWSGLPELLYAEDPRLSSFRTAPDYFERNRAALERLWGSLEDLESQLTLASILRQRTSGDLGYLRVAQYAEYCHPQVKAEPGEVVVDAGAFNGATSTAFARRVGRGGMVYAFEPGSVNRERIRRRLLRPWNWRLRVETQPFALSDRVGTGFFDANRGGAGALRNDASRGGTEETAITTLDDFTSDGRKVDLLSFDIEGAEPAALAGAERLISRQRPKLQVSVYHDLAHLFELPLGLLERHRDYVLFLGHHDVYSTETDAYLVPRERLGRS
jgi:FkbM family methyltransferase